MKVKFRDNLGSVDAAKFGLNHEQCTRGAEVEVPGAIVSALVSGHFADEVPEPIKAVPPKPAIAEAKEPERPAVKAADTPTATKAEEKPPKAKSSSVKEKQK